MVSLTTTYRKRRRRGKGDGETCIQAEEVHQSVEGFLVLRKVPSWGKEEQEDGVHSFCYYIWC